jgi:hypothetical protein
MKLGDDLVDNTGRHGSGRKTRARGAPGRAFLCSAGDWGSGSLEGSLARLPCWDMSMVIGLIYSWHCNPKANYSIRCDAYSRYALS